MKTQRRTVPHISGQLKSEKLSYIWVEQYEKIFNVKETFKLGSGSKAQAVLIPNHVTASSVTDVEAS